MIKTLTKRPIGVFDSGVGGLSVLQEIRRLLPKENFLFVADQEFVPYGEKTPEEIRERSIAIGRFLLKKDVKMIVAACNTATCYAVDAMRENFDVNIVGTVPAIKTACAMTRTGTVAVLATPGTAGSPYLKNLIGQFGSGKCVLAIGCKGWEEAVERGELATSSTIRILSDRLRSIARSDVDTVVLGCTHYPFLRKEIQSILGSHVEIIDSGTAIARRTQSLLGASKNEQEADGSVQYFTTGIPARFDATASLLQEEPVASQAIII